jgi:hypothetical protein
MAPRSRTPLSRSYAGEPGALIATSEAKAFSATSSGHWEELAFTAPPTTIGGVKYWLACHADASVNSRGSDGTNQNDARRLIAQPYASGLPDPFGAGRSYSNTRGMKMLVWTNLTRCRAAAAGLPDAAGRLQAGLRYPSLRDRSSRHTPGRRRDRRPRSEMRGADTPAAGASISCSLAGEDLSTWLVSEGLALAFRRFSERLVAVEEAAKTAGVACGRPRSRPLGRPGPSLGSRRTAGARRDARSRATSTAMARGSTIRRGDRNGTCSRTHCRSAPGRGC